MEKYLVTGGAGFIGSHIVETLLQKGQCVRVLDNFDTGTRENLKGFSGNLEIVGESITDPARVADAMKGIDYVLHEAARGSVPRSVEDPLGTQENNITGTLNVLEAARKAGVRRVVCASSSSVYGETEELPKRESMLPSPKSPYALSKLTLEHWCRIYAETYSLETVSLRYFNVYGPRQNPNLQYAAVIPIFIRNMLQNKKCIIYGDGEQTRDFTYIEDCVSANLLACKAKNVAGEVLNIACAQQTSVNELFRFLSQILNYTQEPVFEPLRAGDVRDSVADITLAKQKLDFHPKISLAEGLQKTVAWYSREFSR
ncbi:MAG: LPS biosynthesis protein WbpP [Acidobacteria bacterium]|nr:MAG: LPS biosynthesis protein WbpP [Acidobacteriota bacterium]